MSSIVKQSFTICARERHQRHCGGCFKHQQGSQLGKQAASSLRDQFPDSRRRSYQGGDFLGF